jgi:TRAP-type C4-dicarboxylate transport system substrate-binding protein
LVYATGSNAATRSYRLSKGEVWIDALAEQSDGRLILEFYPSGQLIKTMESVDALRGGICEIASFEPSYFGGYFDLDQMIESASPFDSAIQGNLIYEAIYDDYLKPRRDELGIKLLQWGMGSPYWLYTKKLSAYKLEELNGMTIRSGIQTVTDTLVELDALPVNLPWSEVYESLQKNLVDAAITRLGLMWNTNFYEFGDPGYCINVGGWGQTNTTVHIRQDVFDELPADLQQLLVETGRDIASVNYWYESDLSQSEAVRGMQEHGCVIIDWTQDEKSRLRNEYIFPIIDKLAVELDSQGMLGTELRAKILEVAPGIVADNPVPTEQEARRYFLDKGYTDKDLEL